MALLTVVAAAKPCGDHLRVRIGFSSRDAREAETIAQAGENKHAETLDTLQRMTFDYFLKETNPENGLIADRNRPGSPASIAVMGLAFSVYIAAVRRGVLSRACSRAESPDGPAIP